MPASTRRFNLGVICGLMAAAIWGGGAVVSRHLVTTSLDVWDITLLRYAGCFPVALLLVLVLGERVRLAIGWPRVAVQLLLAGPLYHALVVAGYRHATAGSGALLLSGLLPVLALGLTCALAGAPPSRAAAGGITAVLAGLAIFSGHAGAAGVSPSGVLIFATAALAWALLNECVRRWQVDPLKLTVTLALFSPLFAPVYLLGRPSLGLSAPPADMLLQTAYHGWLVAIGATALFFASVRLAGAPVAAILQTLSPAFSAGLGAAILGEPLELAQVAGLALALVGVLVTIRGPGTARADSVRVPGATGWLRAAALGVDLRPWQSR
ncbi:MAG: DMT family transporter [Hyphomicrobiaceae bacterium]|nr:DMT family transporter [Hyphomicrobiaceae bacterium]